MIFVVCRSVLERGGATDLHVFIQQLLFFELYKRTSSGEVVFNIFPVLNGIVWCRSEADRRSSIGSHIESHKFENWKFINFYTLNCQSGFDKILPIVLSKKKDSIVPSCSCSSWFCLVVGRPRARPRVVMNRFQKRIRGPSFSGSTPPHFSVLNSFKFHIWQKSWGCLKISIANSFWGTFETKSMPSVKGSWF